MTFWSKKIDGVIALILGLVILIFPFKVFTALSLIVGVLLVITGVRRLYDKIRMKNKRVINSLLMIAIGVVLLLPNTIIPDRDVLGYLLGGMFIYNGIRRMITYRRVNTPMNRSLASAGVIAIVIGVIIALLPEIIIIAFTIIIGLILVAYGALRLFVKMGTVNKFRPNVNFGDAESPNDFVNVFRSFGQEMKQEFQNEINDEIIDVDTEQEQ